MIPSHAVYNSRDQYPTSRVPLVAVKGNGLLACVHNYPTSIPHKRHLDPSKRSLALLRPSVICSRHIPFSVCRRPPPTMQTHPKRRSLGTSVGDSNPSPQLPVILEWISLEAVCLLWAMAIDIMYICLDPAGRQDHAPADLSESPVQPASLTTLSTAMDRFKSLIDRRLLCLRQKLLGSPQPAPGAAKNADKAEAGQDLVSRLRPIVAPFIQKLGYAPSPKGENEKLWVASLVKADSMGLPCPEGSSNWKRLKVGYSYAHVSSPAGP